jgi:nitroreductase
MKTTILLLLAVFGISACVLAAQKPTDKTDPLSKILAERHSGRSFDASRLVTQDQLKHIVKAGQLAPSSYNDQPWHFIICDRATNPDAYNKALSTLIEFNQKWAKNAPVLIITVASTNSHDNELNRWAQYDTGAAAFSMMLQATSLGLMAHQMGGFDEAKVSKAFKIPKDMVPMAVMALGYNAEKEKNRSIKKERKPLEENFFKGDWGLTTNVWKD